MKELFAESYKDYRISEATAHQHGFGANMAHGTKYIFGQGEYMQETADEIANLAKAAISDKNTMEMLAKTNSILVATNAKHVQKIEELTVALAKAKDKIAELHTVRRNTKYCWSCGHNKHHNSQKCTRKKDGHKDEATASNKCGGNMAQMRF